MPLSFPPKIRMVGVFMLSRAYQQASTLVAFESLTYCTPPTLQTFSKRCSTPGKSLRLWRITEFLIPLMSPAIPAANELYMLCLPVSESSSCSMLNGVGFSMVYSPSAIYPIDPCSFSSEKGYCMALMSYFSSSRLMTGSSFQ